jgi:hypothetical protein
MIIMLICYNTHQGSYGLEEGLVGKKITKKNNVIKALTSQANTKNPKEIKD